MQITITTEGEEIFPVEVSNEIELENFKALLEFQSNVKANEMKLYLDGKALNGDKSTLESLGVKNGDIILLMRSTASVPNPVLGTMMPTGPQTVPGTTLPAAPRGNGSVPAIDWGMIQVPPVGSRPVRTRPSSSQPRRPQQQNLEDPESIRQVFLSDPNQMSLLKERNPPLANALLSGNLEEFTKVLQDQRKQRLDHEAERIRMHSADPFDMEVQRKISEEIRMENVNSNMETAMEYQPESFGQVFMLYVDCKVNGHPVKAFVDSGAQMTIMSQACAARCGITRLIDHRWAGTAIGVGTQKIIGRVHMCQMQIGKDFLTTSFAVLEEQPMDILLGLDMLKRHQCCIDLKRGVLLIGTTNSETPFLAEADLPTCARLNSRSSEPVPSTSDTPMQQEEDRMLAEAMAKSVEEASKNKT